MTCCHPHTTRQHIAIPRQCVHTGTVGIGQCNPLAHNHEGEYETWLDTCDECDLVQVTIRRLQGGATERSEWMFRGTLAREIRGGREICQDMIDGAARARFGNGADEWLASGPRAQLSVDGILELARTRCCAVQGTRCEACPWHPDRGGQCRYDGMGDPLAPFSTT